jgi:predicted dehydrogenase
MKALIVGLGSIGQRHAKNLYDLLGNDLELIAYRVRNRTLTIEHKIVTYYTLEDALDAKPDIALICNLPNMHMDTALAIAKRGIPFLIEKPLSHTYERVDELIEVVNRQNLVAMVGYQLRFHPIVQKIPLDLKLAEPICSVQVEISSRVTRYHINDDYQQMYESHEELGGGVIRSQIHELDYLYSLFGLPKRIFAMGGHLSSLQMNTEDVACILMECEVNGRTFPVYLYQDFLSYPARRTCRIIGTSNILDYDLLKGINRNTLFIAEIQHFLNCVAMKEQPIVTIQEGAQSLRMALAAKESLITGKVIRL